MEENEVCFLRAVNTVHDYGCVTKYFSMHVDPANFPGGEDDKFSVNIFH